MRVDLHPEARAELRSAALWYDERLNSLGEEFVAAADAAFQKIAEAPQAFPRWSGTEQAATVIRKVNVERWTKPNDRAMARRTVSRPDVPLVSLVRAPPF